MFKIISIVLCIFFVQFSIASDTGSDTQRWQYRWSENDHWVEITSPCSPPGRENRDVLFLKLMRANSEPTHLLIKDQSFSFKLINQDSNIANLPADRIGYLAGYDDFLVNIGNQTEIQFRAVSEAKNHIGFCKGVFLGTESTLKEKLIRESFIPFVSGLVCLFLSFFLFFLSRIEISPPGFLASSLTAFLLGTWTFALPNNNFKDFLLPNSTLWLWIDQISIMLFPSTLIGILEFLTGHSLLKSTKFLKYIHTIFAVVSAIAVLSGVAKFYQTNLVFNLIVPFTIILIIVEIVRNVWKFGREIIALLIGVLCITAAGVNDLLVGLWIWPQNPLKLPLGFVGFSIAVTYSTIVWAEQKRELTKKLALESAQLSAAVNTIQTVAHDVRRPFSMLKMLIEMIQTINNSQEQKQLLMIAKPEIEQATASAESLIQDLLNLGKPIQLEIASTSITSIIEKSLLLVGPAARESQAYLKLNLNHKHQLKIDPGKIERVIVNILQNALEAMPNGAVLTIQTAEAESKFLLFLRNSGSYIEYKELQKIFEKFHTSGKTNGTGLGLHISKQFVEAHGGLIECRSEKGISPSENFVEFQIAFNSSDIPDRTTTKHQLDRYFSIIND